MSIQPKRIGIILLGVGVLLSIPLIAMQFSDEVNWDATDFLVMGTLLLAVGLIGDWAIRKIKNAKRRWFYIAILILFFLLLWAEMAVGIFETPIAGD